MAQFEIPEIKLMLEELRSLRTQVEGLCAKLDSRTEENGKWFTTKEMLKL